MSIGTFHYVQGLISNYHELMVTDKDNLQLWSKRAHAALRAYQVPIFMHTINYPI